MYYKSDTGPYTMALVSCLVLAVFTYFFPMSSGARTWQAVVVWLFALGANCLYLKKDELKDKPVRTFNETIGYLYTYAIEVVFIVFIPLKLLADKVEVGVDLVSVVDAYIFIILFILYLQYSVLGTIASEKGMHGGLVTIGGLLGAAASMVLFYFEVTSPGLQVPALAQPLCFLPALLLLLRLRTLESYGHI